MNNNRFILPFAIIGVSMICSVIIFGSDWKSTKKENQTITVTGSAKKEITSDLGVLRGTLTAFEKTSQEGYSRLESQKPMLMEYLASKGFTKEKVAFETVNVYAQYSYSNGNQGGIIGYNVSQSFKLDSKDVQAIRELSLDITSLYAKGLSFQISPPEYYYTKLAEIKIDIQAEAARDAMNRAKKIAEATESKLGPMRTARMGVLQITPINSNMVSDYGMNDVSAIEKEITAVVNASFEIE